MSKLSHFALQILAGVFVFTSSLVAESEKEEPKKEDNHIQPGTRPLSHIERVKIQEERFKEAEESDETQDVAKEEEKEEGSENKATLTAASMKTGIFFTTHPGAFYNPVVISAFGDTVELHDGSIWSIASGDSYKTLNWLVTDSVVITANHDWFSTYYFRMTNQETGVSVKCNIVLGPIYNGLHTHWIVAIDYLTKEIFLEDGTRWSATAWDASTFNNWLPNDTIMIGINDGSRSSNFPNILINVNTLTYLRAICL